MRSQPLQRVPKYRCASTPLASTVNTSSRPGAQEATLGTQAPPGLGATGEGPRQVPASFQCTTWPLTASRAITSSSPGPAEAAAGERTGWPPGPAPRSLQPLHDPAA